MFSLFPVDSMYLLKATECQRNLGNVVATGKIPANRRRHHRRRSILDRNVKRQESKEDKVEEG